ncbi:MAG: hypothetical protein FWE31_03865 [Firmicutes bacterium]|nr:hypothetical protein [Bacillota bacterium]
MKHKRYKQDPEILRANGIYGHLGGRPRKRNPEQNPQENPQGGTPPEFLENPQEILDYSTTALQRLAFGYSVGKYHFPPNLKALQILMERGENNLREQIAQEIIEQVTRCVKMDVYQYYLTLFHEKYHELGDEWLSEQHSYALTKYRENRRD